MVDDERDDTEAEPHGLFLPESPDDPIVSDVRFISVTRISPTRENAGRAFNADEIPDLAALKAMFGGGVYRVIARDEKRKVLRGGQRDYTLQGTSYPMDGSGPPPAAAVPLAPGANAIDARIDRLERLLERVLTQPAQPAQQAFPLESILKMQADSSANMLAIMKEVMQAKPGQEATHEVFLAGQEHAAAIYQGIIDAEREKAANGAGDGAADVEILRTVQAVFEGMRTAKTTNGANGSTK